MGNPPSLILRLDGPSRVALSPLSSLVVDNQAEFRSQSRVKVLVLSLNYSHLENFFVLLL